MFRFCVLSILWELLVALAASGADVPVFTVESKLPTFTVVEARPVACFNCPSCGDACQCFGGGYYCEPGKCAAQRPLKPADVKPPVPGAVKTREGNWIVPDGKGGWRFVESAPKVEPKQPDSGVIPGPVVPARGQWVKVCNGNGTCRLVWVPTP